jgi:hypothetical protein
MADPAYIVDGVLTDGEAWVGIAHAAVSLPAATVTFTSTDDGQTGDFSQYMDLVLISYARSAVAAVSGGCYIRFNDDTATNYSVQWLYGNGSTIYVNSGTTYTYIPMGNIPAASAGANEFNGSVVHMFDINSGKHKSCLSQNAQDSNGDGQAASNVSMWRSQEAITEIDITASADLVAGSKFSLFGILPRMVAVP